MRAACVPPYPPAPTYRLAASAAAYAQWVRSSDEWLPLAMSGWGRWERSDGGGGGWGQQAYRSAAGERSRRNRSRSPGDSSRSGRSHSPLARKRRPGDDRGDDGSDDGISGAHELSLQQLVTRNRLSAPGVESDLAASAGAAISAEFRSKHGVAPTKKRIVGEAFKVSVYGKRDHEWIIGLLRKATRGELPPVAPTPGPTPPATHGGWGGDGGARRGAVGTGNVKSEYTCTACQETKHRTAFSNNMLKGNKSVLRCKICVNGAVIVAAAGRTGQGTIATNCTMQCSVCGEWKDTNWFSNSQRSGRQRKCQNCAAQASSALTYRCVYCHDDHSGDANPVSKFPREFRDPPFGPCCHRGECIAEYRRRQCGGDEARKKAEQLEKAAEAMKAEAAEAAATKAALEESLANQRQVIADKESALREAQAKQNSMSQAAQNAKVALETEQQRKSAQLDAMDAKFASEKADWEAKVARFEQERGELTQTIEQVEKDKQQFEEEKEEAEADAEMHLGTVENMATTLSRWQLYADKLKKQLVDEGAEPLSWAAFRSGGFK